MTTPSSTDLQAAAESARGFRVSSPQLWLTFGFRNSGVWVVAKDERANLVAQRRFAQFLRSEKRIGLSDARLDRLIAVTKGAKVSAVLLFSATVATWLHTEVWQRA